MAEAKTDGFWMFFLLVFAAFTLSLPFVTQDYVRSASVKEEQNIELELGRSTLINFGKFPRRIPINAHSCPSSSP